MRRFIFTFAAAILLALPATAAAQPEPPAGTTPIKGESLAARLKGGTFSYPSSEWRTRTITFGDGVAYVDHPQASGRDQARSAPWRVKGGMFCLAWSDGSEECHAVRAAGDALYVKVKEAWLPFERR